jgi:hypothetical protein
VVPVRRGRSARVESISGSHAARVFVRYFVDLPASFERVQERLLRSPERWIPRLAEDAEARGRGLMAEVGLGPALLRLDKRVRIELLRPVRYPATTILPMRWTPEGGESLFPTFDADVEVAEFGPARTQLSVSARYSPPLGVVGRWLDRMLMHRVAEAMFKDFLDHVADAIGADATTETSAPVGLRGR